MERLTDHENEHYNQPGCNSCSDYRWRSCKESGEIDDCIQRLTWLRLLDIEDILGDDYDLDRLRELVEADRDGRCVVLPCKIGDTLYRIQRFKRGKNWRKEAEYIRTVELNKNNFWRVVFEGELGETVFLTREAAEAALKGK